MLGAYYKYIDHTADIQILAVGNTLESAFEQAVMGTTNLMTNMHNISEVYSKEINCSAPDKEMLLVDYLTEYLAIFDIENLLFSRVEVHEIIFDPKENNFKISSRAFGDIYNPKIHEIKTEVKAVTYSYLKIVEEYDKTEILFVLDL